MTMINKIGAQPMGPMKQNPSFGENTKANNYYVVMQQPQQQSAGAGTLVKKLGRSFAMGAIFSTMFDLVFNRKKGMTSIAKNAAIGGGIWAGFDLVVKGLDSIFGSKG